MVLFVARLLIFAVIGHNTMSLPEICQVLTVMLSLTEVLSSDIQKNIIPRWCMSLFMFNLPPNYMAASYNYVPFKLMNQCTVTKVWEGWGGWGGTYFLLALLYDLVQEITSAPGHPWHNSLCWALMALEYCEQLWLGKNFKVHDTVRHKCIKWKTVNSPMWLSVFK